MSDSEDASGGTFSEGNDMDIAIRNIYEACDDYSTGRVLVSKLVEYIKPYMEANVSDLQKLKESLDPDDIDPEIDCDTFYDGMTRWAKKFNQEESFHNISPRYLDAPPLVESTPRKSFGNRQLRVYAEAAALNMSVVEKTSFMGTTDMSESGMEKSALEEQIKQLAYQSKKFNDELLLARSQLSSQEEQNLVLQNEIEKLTKDLMHEREINENLLKESKTFEEMRDNSFNNQKIIDKLNKNLQQLEKENQLLQTRNGNLDHERQKTEEKIVSIHEKLSKSRKEAVELRAEIQMKEEQLSAAEEVKTDLLRKIEDLKDINNNMQEANNCLTVEKDKISKLLQEHLRLQSQAMLNNSAQKQQSEYKSKTTKSTHTQTHTTRIKHVTPSTQKQIQQHSDISKFFGPSMPSPRKTNTPDTHTACKSMKSNTQVSWNDDSPIPFASPIKTTRFQFYNIDSPIAKRCTSLQSIPGEVHDNKQLHNAQSVINSKQITTKQSPHVNRALVRECSNSPATPTDFASPPGLFVVERSETRKPSADLDNSFDECCNDEDMMPTAPEYLTQASLKEELQQSSPTSSSIDSEMSSSNCFGNSEVKKRLDDLYDQIDWLKIENTSLKQSKEDVVELIQTKLHLESVNKERDQTIVDLNKTLKVAKNNEEELSHQCADLKEKLQNLEEIKRNFDIITKEITVLKDNIQVLKDDKDKLIKENSVNESMIERLKDNLKTLENAKKCLELKINNIQAEKDILIEEHKIHIDQYSTKIEQYQSDITKLEKKFYASNDQVTSLLATNEESATTNAKLFLQHQKLVDVHQELQADYQYYTQTINATCTKDLSTRHKLQLLIKAKDSYSKLETRLELLIQEKQKESVDLNSKIIELEKKCAQLNRNTPRKTPHDRAQLKIEKLREKVDHLEDTLKKEKSKQASLQEEQEQLQKCNDSLIKEKIIILKETEESKRNLDKLQNTYSELFDVVKNILSGSLKLRHNMLKLSKLWKPLFDKVSAVGGLVKYLGEDDRNNHCSLKEIIQAQNDIQTITLILDALGTYNLHGFINGGKPVEEQNVLKNFDFLSRPMSPDSPNLGSVDVVASIGAGDSLVNCVGVLEDSEGCEADVDIGPGSEEDDFTDRLKDLHKMYSSDHLEFLMTNVGLEKSCENLDLQAFVDDFALTFMVDCTGYKNRLLGQFEVLQETVTRLVEHLQTFTTPGSDLKRRNQSMVALVRCLFELTKSAEQYGAIQQEIQSSQNINCLITHITNLRELKDNRKMAAARLRGETVYVDNLHGSPSGGNQLCEGPQNHLMSMLNAMRPANVVRLVGAVALAFLVYYFSQRFVSMLAASDLHGGGGGRRDAVCWSSWLDLLASCFGRLREDGPPPV